MKMIQIQFFLLLFFSFFILKNETAAQNDKPYNEKIPGTDLSIEMIPVPGGEYDLSVNGKSYNVEVSPFWMASRELTHDIFSVYFDDNTISRDEPVDAITRPSPQYVDLTWGMGREGGFPANSMSLYTAVMISKWLYDKTGHFYRPPTEAEWQVACLTGKNDQKKIDEIAVFKENSDEKYRKSGSKAPDNLGLYDMLGNIAEWTVDAYAEDYKDVIKSSGKKDPHLAPASRKASAILKGGHYLTPKEEMGCASRIHSEKWWNQRDPQIPKSRWWYTDAPFAGIRLVRPVQQPPKSEIEKFYDQFLK